MRRALIAAGALALVAVLAPVASAQEWGTIKGKIIWGDDKIPEPEDLTDLIKKNPDAAFCLKDGKVFDEKWVINKKNKGIKWTFVWLSNGDPKAKKPLPIHPKLAKIDKETVEIDQPVCMYMPHATAIREGQTLVCKNAAKVSHNFLYISSKLNGNPLLLPGKTYTLTPKDGLTAEVPVMTISCSIHTWMKGYVRVFDHPYFAVTDSDGAFTIENAPAGKYNLMVWHGSGGYRGGALGRTGKVIEIQAGKVTDLGNLDYPPPAP